MPDQTQHPKKRRLHSAPETVRERAERTASSHRDAPVKASRFGGSVRRVGSILATPFRFVGRYLIPPYVRSSWRELRLVSWPNRTQTRQLTTAVILFSVVFGALIAVFDFGLERLFKEVIVK